MRVIKKYQYSGAINPVTEEDYLNYWRDNNVESDEALIKRLEDTYGKDHMQRWIQERQFARDNPYAMHPGTGTLKKAPVKPLFSKSMDALESTINSNTLPGGLARTVGVATLGAPALIYLPATIGGVIGGKLVDNATGGFGEQVENLIGIDRRFGSFLNPGFVVGGGFGDVTWNLGKFLYNVPKVTKGLSEGFLGFTNGRSILYDRKNRFKNFIGNGAEGFVYSDGNGHAYKINDNLIVNHTHNGLTFNDKIENLNTRFNSGIPNIFPTEIRGYIFDIKSGRILPVTRQTELRPNQILDNIPYRDRANIPGYSTKLSDLRHNAHTKDYIVTDTHGGNIAVLDDGSFVIIDPLVYTTKPTLPSHKEFGGEKYIENLAKTYTGAKTAIENAKLNFQNLIYTQKSTLKKILERGKNSRK